MVREQEVLLPHSLRPPLPSRCPAGIPLRRGFSRPPGGQPRRRARRHRVAIRGRLSDGWCPSAAILLFRFSELGAAQDARKTVEARYLAGHTALFPDAVQAWDAQLTSTQTIADVACRLAVLDAVPPAEPADPDAVSARVTELVADLVEPAKTTALEKLGEGERAQHLAIGWLRPKFGFVAAIANRPT